MESNDPTQLLLLIVNFGAKNQKKEILPECHQFGDVKKSLLLIKKLGQATTVMLKRESIVCSTNTFI